jgi:PAS domain S-box-containing protein
MAQSPRCRFSVYRALYRTSDGKLWVGTGGAGLSVFDGRNFRTYTTAQGLSDNLIFTVGEDRAGNLWVGTNSGAMKVRQSGFTTYTRADGLGHDFVCSIFETRTGEFYAITGGWRINRLDRMRFTAVQPNLPRHIAESSWRVYQNIFQDHTGDWWVSTSEGLYRFPKVPRIERLAEVQPKAVYTTRDGLAGNDVAWLFEDSRGDVWISTFTPGREVLTRWDRATGRFHRYSDTDGLPAFNAAGSFCEDGSGNVWIGFREGGLARFSAGRFITFGPDDGLPSGAITSLHIDRAGRLWVASQLDGLKRIDDPAAERPRFVTHTVAYGLENISVSLITEDGEGRLYIGTWRGVDRLDQATGHIMHYTRGDGLAAVGILSAFRDRQGALWFGTVKGLSKLVPQPDRVRSPPTVFISGLRIAGLAYALSDLGASAVASLELEPNQNQIQIDFFGLSISPGEDLLYQYKLEGVSEQWSEPSERRVVDLAGIAAGQYRFLVRAISADGAVSQTPATVAFTILTPVWRRGWFLTLAAVIIGVAAYAVARYRFARIKSLRESEMRFRTLAETASDAIITIDEASVIVFVNPAAEAVFGYTVADMLGAELTMLMPEYLRHLHRAGFSRYKQTAQKHIAWEAIELPGLHKSGREIPLELSFGEFTKDDRRFFTGIARDITERKRAEEALLRSNEERLIEIEKVRRRIATDLHDDIGSSLTQISILSEVVRRRAAPTEPAEAEPLSLIASASRELVDSMSDIVWSINPKKDHLSDLTQRMRHFASDVFTARNIEFRLSVPDADQDVRLGANLRREIFLIFKESINNLVRHSGCTRADIIFRVEEDWLILKVSDNGKGFDPASHSEGHGVLSMSERARDAGGQFEVISNPGEGTTVQLRLPFGQSLQERVEC